MILKVNRLIIIHIDTLRREYPYCYLLKKGFEQLGYRVLLVSRRNIRAVLNIVLPEILIVSHCFSLSSDFMRKIKDKTDIYVIGVEAIGDGSYMWPYDYPEEVDLRSFKGIFLWNRYFRDWLIQNREIASERVYCVGSPRVSMSKYIEKKNTNVIGFVGRFEFLNTFDKRPALTNLINMKDDRRHFLYRFFAEVEGAVIYGDIIDYLINSGFKVSIRPHPQECESTYNVLKDKYKGKLAVDDSADYLGWLESVGLIVATLSTSLTEAYLIGKPIISVDRMFKENYMIHYDKWMENYMSIAYAPSSLEEVKELFKNDLNAKRSSPEMDEYLERHYNIKGDQGFDALEKIVRVIHKESGTGNRCPWVRYMFVRVMFFHLDIILLIRSYFRKTLYREFHYNYCCFWNKPTSFMKRAASQFVASLK